MNYNNNNDNAEVYEAALYNSTNFYNVFFAHLQHCHFYPNFVNKTFKTHTKHTNSLDTLQNYSQILSNIVEHNTSIVKYNENILNMINLQISKMLPLLSIIVYFL